MPEKFLDYVSNHSRGSENFTPSPLLTKYQCYRVSGVLVMSEPNQRSIKSFFGGPKHPRTQESATDNVENQIN